MNDKQKRLAVIGGGAAVIGAYALSRKTKGSGGGGGSIFGSSGNGLTMPGDGGVGVPESNPAATIADILSGLPPVRTFTGGGGFNTPSPAAAMAGIPQVMSTGGGGVTTKKESFSLSSIVTGATPVMQAGAWSVMFPVQTLGGVSARIADAVLSYAATPEELTIIHKKQAENVIKYPRAASAISMLTGGVTAHAPPTKKQLQARENHPYIYNAWKTLFSWAGA